jgi:hypothetical protein
LASITLEIAELRASVSGHKRIRALLITAAMLLIVAVSLAVLWWRLRLADAPAPVLAPAAASGAMVEPATAAPAKGRVQ